MKPELMNKDSKKYHEKENDRLCRMLDYLNRFGFEVATLVIGSVGATLCFLIP